MSGDRGSVAGIELLTRTSLNSLRDANHVSATSYLWETLNPQPMDDRNWSWPYLRLQFRLKNLEDLYQQYQNALHRGYFTVFLIVQTILCLAHVTTILSSISEEMAEDVYLPDVVGYNLAMVLTWPLLWTVYRKQSLLSVSILAVVFVTVPDLLLPIYHTLKSHSPSLPLRPAFTTHTLLTVYVFMPLARNRHAAAIGFIVTICHLLILANVTYYDSPRLKYLLFGDATYLICVNGLGLYFRFVNEVVVRRTFLDRRACVESTLKLNYEKEQEEQLMLNILPQHIATRVKTDIWKVFHHIKQYHNEPLKKKPFSELYVEKHKDVSILFADVVNYSHLTVSLPANRLVETLNELFSRFDEASEERGVLRIKFLGDCYYCVSGVPQPNPEHAKSCVEFGLDMITIIQEVRKRRNLDIDMRIGVHSGKIWSGLLGVCKWQYDIWSQDVVIANHMEQSGKPGKVHVTGQTLCLLDGHYSYELGHGASRDPLLAKHNITTFLISPGSQHSCGGSRSLSLKRGSTPTVSGRVRQPSPYNSKGTTPILRRRTMFMDNNLVLYQEMLRMADKAMSNAIDQMPIGNYKSWPGENHVDPVCLTFTHLSWECPFLQQPDPLFKFYIGATLSVLICMFTVQRLGTPSWHIAVWVCFLTALGLLLVAFPFTWTHFIWNTARDPHQELDLIPEPSQPLLRILYRASVRVVWSNAIRTTLYLIITLFLALCALVDLVECDSADTDQAQTENLKRTSSDDIECLTPWHVTEICSLAILMCFLFVRVHFQLKLFVSCLIVAAHVYCVLIFRPHIFKAGDSWNPILDPQIAHIMSIVFLTFSLHLMDRQAEYMNRLDYRWKRQLAEEQDLANTTRMVNKMLLQNILPSHVAEVYLNTSRVHEELYYEQYSSVSVMFATLTENEPSSTEPNELVTLEILNQIICDFDKLLFEPSSQRMEKIKVAGWTYMAACGLEPGRRDSNADTDPEIDTDNLFILTRFAANMIRVLNKFNINNKRDFQLRVGIAHGAVTAGVVGSQKPLYDIWGDTVNLASRMDSTGVAGKIQVTKETSKLLEKYNIHCELRGSVYVKGKEYLTTYFMTENDIKLLAFPKPSVITETTKL